MKRSLLVPVLLPVLLAALPVSAQTDPRLRTIPYAPGAVFTVRVVPGFVATVVLNPDERIESVAIGNSAAWDVTPSKSGDHLFIKPLGTGAPTNVEVVTDSRHYSFLLQPTFDGDPEAAFRLRFDYASDAVAPVASPAPVAGAAGDVPLAAQVVVPQAAYRVSGDRLARPLSVSDDGVRTLFAFADAATLPAIYAIDEQHHEMLVTTRRTGDGWTIDRIWPRYVLRVGRATAQVRRRDPVGAQ